MTEDMIIEGMSKEIKEKSLQHRALLKADVFQQMGEYWDVTDQRREFDTPPIQKDFIGELIKLPDINPDLLTKKDVYECINNRRSRRNFTDQKITLDELSFLLWATQGVQRTFQDGKITIRTTPSGGARHPFETYLAVFNVHGLNQGVYRYLPLEHAITFLFNEDDLANKVIAAAARQDFAGETGVTFIWAAIPYRTEWRYGFASAKTILLDCGHICQNLYIACEALKLGTCAIAAYDQKKIDELLKLDGEDEFAVYLAPVGRY